MQTTISQKTGVISDSQEARLIYASRDACPACQSVEECFLRTSGFVPWYDRGTTEEMRRGWPNYSPVYRWYKCERLKEKEQLQQAKAFIPERFAVRTWDKFVVDKDNQEAYKICREYSAGLSKETKSGLLICGDVGVGKTHLAVAILSTAFRKGISAAMVYIPDLLAELRKEMQDDEKKGLADKVRSRRFLVLDDLGAEKASEWTEQELARLINYRYENMLPTVITTNLTRKELIEKLGQRGADRLNQMCSPVLIFGKSRRIEMRKRLEE